MDLKTTQDKSQEAFEARFKSSFDLGLNNSGQHKNERTYLAFIVFKYARKQALEEQSTEIAELKAKLAGAEAEIAALKQGLHRADEKLAEVMPLAKYGAEVANYVDGIGAVSIATLWRIAKRVGVLTQDESEHAPNIGDIIDQLLKD